MLMDNTLFFLKASVPLTKEYEQRADGSISKNSYPNVYEVTSLKEKNANLAEFASLLQHHAKLGHCLVKGELSRPLTSESRAGTTDPNAATWWILFDLDGVSFKSPDEFMHAIGYPNVSYVVQYSASHHIYDKTLRCHIAVLLSKPCAAASLKQYLISWNFTTPALKSMLTLTRTGMSLRYGLDITTCQNDKLIYIANPILKNVVDPFKGKQRIQYVKKKTELFVLPSPPSLVVNKAEVEAHIATLRETAKLPARKNTFKHVRNVEILAKPDEAIITGIKEDRGFVYFNFNGGDSWAYYHPSNNSDFIYNFKGEATYLTKELLPEYWSQVTQAALTTTNAPPQQNAQGVVHLAFLDKRSSGYWRGTYNHTKDFLDLYAARTETQIRHFAAANNVAIGEFIPEWDIAFDPKDNVRVDAVNRSINLFQPTKYMLAAAKPKPIKTIPPTIQKIIAHVVNHDVACLYHFINWVAYIVQFRAMTRTAWVMHGTEGTGKGLLFNNILRPLFGETQTVIHNMSALDEIYNSYLERSFIVAIDEVQTSNMRSEKGVMAKLRNFISEPKVAIRAMYQTAYETTNYSNWLFFSNQPDPITVPKEDRRFNVAPYQPDKLQITQDEIQKQLPAELHDFYQYLMEYKVDENAAHTPLLNEARKTLIGISESSIDTVATAIIQGDFAFFMEQLPTNQLQANLDREVVDHYKATLIHLLERKNTRNICNISRDELRAIFEYTVGDMPKSPNKFSSRLKHHRIHFSPTRINDKIVQGMTTTWADTSLFAAYKAQLIGKPQITLVKSSKSK